MFEAGQDQATGLRRLFARDEPDVLSVRGGGGATPVTLDLAGALAALGHRPLIVDREMDRAAIMPGFAPRFDFAHVLRGDKTLAEVLFVVNEDVAVLPAAQGLEHAAAAGSWKRTLAELLREGGWAFDVWLVNGGAGSIADTESPLVVTEPTRDAITGAYAEIKSLVRSQGQRDFRIVVDRAASESAARSVYSSIAQTSRRFLSARLDYCGYLPHDERGGNGGSAARAELLRTQSPRACAISRLAEAVIAAMPTGRAQTASSMRT